MPSLNDRFLPMFKNMRFETIVQICHVTQPVFMTLFPGFGITFFESAPIDPTGAIKFLSGHLSPFLRLVKLMPIAKSQSTL